MNNAKQRLIKQKAYLEEESKKRIQQEEERKELNDNVYSEEIRMCEFLIRYCRQFQKKEQKQVEEKKKEEQKKNNLENEKLEVVHCKREQDNDFQVSKGKKKTKGKQMKQNNEEKKEDNKISHKLDVLEFFE